MKLSIKRKSAVLTHYSLSDIHNIKVPTEEHCTALFRSSSILLAEHTERASADIPQATFPPQPLSQARGLGHSSSFSPKEVTSPGPKVFYLQLLPGFKIPTSPLPYPNT